MAHLLGDLGNPLPSLGLGFWAVGQVCVVAQRAAEQDWEEVNMGAPALNPRLCPFLTLPGSHWPSLALHGLPGLPWHHLWSNKLSLPKKPSKGQGEGDRKSVV